MKTSSAKDVPSSSSKSTSSTVDPRFVREEQDLGNGYSTDGQNLFLGGLVTSMDLPHGHDGICETCHRTTKVLKCRACLSAVYCSEDCRVQSLNAHKPMCDMFKKKAHTNGVPRPNNTNYTMANSVAVDLLAFQRAECSGKTKAPPKIRALLNGACDIRDILLSLANLNAPEAGDAEECKEKSSPTSLEFDIVDMNPTSAARIVVLLHVFSLLTSLERSDAKSVKSKEFMSWRDFLLRFWYSAVLTGSDRSKFEIVLNQCSTLYGSGESITETPSPLPEGFTSVPLNVDFAVTGRDGLTFMFFHWWYAKNFDLDRYYKERDFAGDSIVLRDPSFATHIKAMNQYNKYNAFNYDGPLSGGTIPSAKKRGDFLNTSFLVVCSYEKGNLAFASPSTFAPYMGWDLRDMARFASNSECEGTMDVGKSTMMAFFSGDLHPVFVHGLNHLISQAVLSLNLPSQPLTVNCVVYIGDVKHPSIPPTSKYDRISFSNLADYFGVEMLLRMYRPFLNEKNRKHATMVFYLQNWWNQAQDILDELYDGSGRTGNASCEAYLKRLLGQGRGKKIGDLHLKGPGENTFCEEWGHSGHVRVMLPAEMHLEWVFQENSNLRKPKRDRKDPFDYRMSVDEFHTNMGLDETESVDELMELIKNTDLTQDQLMEIMLKKM